MVNFGNIVKNAAMSGMSGGNRPGMGMGSMNVRRRPGQTLMGAIVGVLVGVVLVLASPFALWQAESQHKAKDFQSAEQVEADSGTEGYVTFQGVPTVDIPLSCVEDQASCLYYNMQSQELKTIQEEQCGTVSDDARVLYSTVLECDEDGNNCQQCYQVERDVWTTMSEDTQYTNVQVGAYTVGFNGNAVMLGLEETIIDHSATTRDVWTYFPIPTELRVAGDAEGSTVAGAELTYVLSPYDYDQTLAELQSLDATAKWMFRIITFFMLFIGFSAILGPLSYFSHLMRKVPLVGPFIKEGAKLIVAVVSFLLAVVTFLVVWLVIAVVKNIFVVVGLLMLGFGVFFFFLKKGHAEGGAATSGPVEPTPPAVTMAS
jgi:uncharacterized Tic20 family protein